MVRSSVIIGLGDSFPELLGRELEELAAGLVRCRIQRFPSLAMAIDIQVPVSVGELIDKLTILAIKAMRISDPARLANVLREHAALEEVVQASGLRSQPGLTDLESELLHTNEALWEIEDAIRDCERRSDFGPAFVDLARSVYRTNDHRADLKRRINMACGSLYLEEKSYQAY